MSLKEQLAVLSPGLCARYGLVRLALFGSVARDEDTEASDIDLLAEFENPTPGTMPERYFGLIGEIECNNDDDSDLFTTSIARPDTEESSGKSSVKLLSRTSATIVQSLQSNPKLTIPRLADELDLTERAVEKQIKALREAGIIRRIGPAKGGHWEVLEK